MSMPNPPIHHPRRSLAPILALVAAAFMAGAAATAVLAWTFGSRLAETPAPPVGIARELEASQARALLLGTLLLQQTEQAASLATPSSPAEHVAQADKPQVAPEAALVAPTRTPPREPKETSRAREPEERSAQKTQVMAASPTKAVEPQPAPSTTAVESAPARPATAVNAEELARARAANKIIAIDRNRIHEVGMAEIQPEGVVMRSGLKVRIGDRFASGERLLSVDPANGMITTDARTIIVVP